ncbi:MAG: glycosyltransferase family 39 protein [Phycisphaerae bacterium]|nr:glycosyltransferase family 39 protein [Phycisphaerae bacterium]
MSKDARRRMPVRKHLRPPKEGGLSIENREKLMRVIVLVVIAILAAIPFALGKYFEFNSPGAFDSGGYVYSAKHILDGARIGVEEKTSAQLGTLLVNILGVRLFGFNETGPKLLQTIFQAAALVLMFVAMRKLFGTLPAAVGTIVASVYLSAPVIAKFGNVKEQYMIAFMVMGISCLVLQQLGGKWWLAMLAGAFLIWAPLFKPTGLSAVGATGLFIVAQPLLKNRTWTQTRADILLLLAGAAIAIAPAYIWIIGWDVQMSVPYGFVFDVLGRFVPGGGEAEQVKAASDYVSASRKHIEFSVLFARVMRYYGVLILPIALALGAIITRTVRFVLSIRSSKRTESIACDRFVLLFATWWVLDMAFIWISPRSYEQYYLPLNASAAMLGGYLIAIYCDKAKNAAFAPKWPLIGAVALMAMMIMSLHIFRGLARSPHSGTIYTDPRTKLPERRNGYAQKWAEVSNRRNPLTQARSGWEAVGQYILANSAPGDGIYVWGWFPGIYVQAQRMSPAPKAFEGTMHTLAPAVLSERVAEILGAFEKQPPKFMVDSYKSHFPWDRPPLELWLGARKGFKPLNEQMVSLVEAQYVKTLAEIVDDPDEIKRFEAMKPFRDYVMNNYRIVRSFGAHVLFQRK